jgi:hypothetical protein
MPRPESKLLFFKEIYHKTLFKGNQTTLQGSFDETPISRSNNPGDLGGLPASGVQASPFSSFPTSTSILVPFSYASPSSNVVSDQV